MSLPVIVSVAEYGTWIAGVPEYELVNVFSPTSVTVAETLDAIVIGASWVFDVISRRFETVSETSLAQSMNTSPVTFVPLTTHPSPVMESA